jgi:hypothetical protein
VRTLALVLALLFTPALASCQAAAQAPAAPQAAVVDTVFIYEWSPLPGETIATTGCMGGKIYQAIDMAFIGDEIWDEVVAHEAIHKTQFEKWLKSHNGECPKTQPLFLLSWEIEAYCGVRHFREGKMKRETLDAEYISRLENQFAGVLKSELIEINYRMNCP